jgi:hypothetical protein
LREARSERVTKGEEKMSNNHDVTLTPTMQGTQVHWEMQYGNQKGSGPDSYPVIKLDHDSGTNNIKFTIAGTNDITFLNPPDKSDKPLYVMEVPKGSHKKPSKGVLNGQITSWNVSQNGKTLTITDKNHGAGRDLSYQLNFNNAGALDPIIQNGGGGGNFYQWIQSHPLETGGAALLLIGILAALFRRWTVKSKLNTGGMGPD